MSIEVLNESHHVVDELALVQVARHVLDALNVSALAELSVVLVDVPTMSEMHVKWMDEPGPTDVMAFAMDELNLRGSLGTAQRHGEPTDEGGPAMLGDVVLCPEVAERQAADAGHSTGDELALLTTHGVLHLLGFDHEEPEERAEMFGLQDTLLASWKAARDA